MTERPRTVRYGKAELVCGTQIIEKRFIALSVFPGLLMEQNVCRTVLFDTEIAVCPNKSL